MDISALSTALASISKTEKTTPTAQVEQVEAFMRHLFPSAKGSPEQVMVNSLQQAQHKLVSGFDKADITTPAVGVIEPAGSSNILNTEKMLAAQYGLANSVTSVDFVAKIAGSFSQSINKLVGMQ